MSIPATDQMEGVELEAPSESRLMTDDELRVLEVYDRLETLQLEIALLRAQGILSQEPTPNKSEEQVLDEIVSAEKALLESKATYQVRSNVIEQALIANPIVNAVHASSKASMTEQDLLPLIQQRDQLSVKSTVLSTQLLTANEELKKVQLENIIINRENAELATRMVALAAEANTHRKEDIEDPRLRQQLDDLEVEMKLSKQKWRIMKATASATIVGSGVDWARDPKLLEIVLDEEGEDGPS